MSEESKISIFSKIKEFYFNEDGGKVTLNLKRLILTVTLVFFCLLLPLSIINSSSKETDTSRISRSSSKIPKEKEPNQKQEQIASQTNVGGIKEHTEPKSVKKPARRNVNRIKINYKAKQVLSVNNVNDGKVLPIGVNLIGKLLTSIDTRAIEQIVKVILPYGGKHKGSGGSLPSNTILFGKVSYSGKGNKVLVNFNKGLLPDGQEVQLQAQALSSKDYSVGLSGDLHGNAGGRTAAVLGLTMVGSMSETLVKKEALGQGFNITPKASLQNGFYNGVSKVANMEANRKAQNMAQEQEYVTVDAGHDLIVSLTGSYKSKE